MTGEEFYDRFKTFSIFIEASGGSLLCPLCQSAKYELLADTADDDFESSEEFTVTTICKGCGYTRQFNSKYMPGFTP